MHDYVFVSKAHFPSIFSSIAIGSSCIILSCIVQQFCICQYFIVSGSSNIYFDYRQL